MPRIRSIRVEPFDSVQGIAPDDIQAITGDYARDIARAVEADHYCDDSTCDIHWALKAGAPITAAHLLIGATECAHVDAVRCAHKFNGNVTAGEHTYNCADWPVWKAFHDEHGRECEACGAFTYDDYADQCGNCLATLPVNTSEDDCDDHGYDVCPDCGNVGVKIGADGYEPCTRFRSCWTD